LSRHHKVGRPGLPGLFILPCVEQGLGGSSAVGTNQLLGVIDADLPGVGPKADQSVFTSTKNIAGRNAHSVAADPVFNQVYVPIPAGNSTVCSGAGGGATSDANGGVHHAERRSVDAAGSARGPRPRSLAREPMNARAGAATGACATARQRREIR